jgi:NAD kinase
VSDCGSLLQLSLSESDCLLGDHPEDVDLWDRATPRRSSSGLKSWVLSALTRALDGEARLLRRHRMRVAVHPAQEAAPPVTQRSPPSWFLQTPVHPHSADVHQQSSSSLPEPAFVAMPRSPPRFASAVLNEVIIHRAPAPSSTYCRISVDGMHLTTVVGDGLVLSTPSGSTGYAQSLGASVIDPSIKGVQVCPVNPYSLAFRPMLLPDTSVLMVQFESARQERQLTFLVDGVPTPLSVTDSIVVSSAPPLLSIRPLDS